VIDGWQMLPREKLFSMIDDECNLGIRLDDLIVEDFERTELWDAIHHDISPEQLAHHTWISRTGRGGLHVFARGRVKPVKISGWIELRSGPSQYVVVPPSLHPETGARYEWITDVKSDWVNIIEAPPPVVERLRKRIEVLGKMKPFIEVMIELWVEGHRHNLSLWIPGCLRKCGYSLEEAETIVRTIAAFARDSEIKDRLRTVEDTYKKSLSEIAAWSKLKEELITIVGPDEAEEIMHLLHRPSLEFEIKPLNQLISEAKPIEWIIDNLIPKYGLVILSGKAGVGKSMLALHLAHAIANGGYLFGILPIHCRGRVLIIDNENYPGLYLQRVTALGLNPLEDIDVLNLSEFAIDSGKSLEWLTKVLGENKYSLIVLDSWTNLVRRIDENKAGEVGPVLSRLRQLAYEYCCCFVLIHHLRKNLPYAVDPRDELRGSSVLMNEADIVLVMQNFSKDGIRILRTVKQRYGEERAFEVQFSNQNGKLEILGRRIEAAEAQSEVVKALEAIVQYLEAKSDATTRRELVKNLPSFSEGTLKRAIDLGITLGRILRIKRGLYRLPSKLEEFDA